jgi:PAT family beta-lactamase induction signal transducer AmpG
VLALGCLAWLPYSRWHDALGSGQPIAGTFFTLVFVASALYLLAGSAVLRVTAPRLARLAVWVAPLLFAMHARYHVDTLARWSGASAPTLALVLDAFALIGAALLALFALDPWHAIAAPAADDDAAPVGAAAAA